MAARPRKGHLVPFGADAGVGDPPGTAGLQRDEIVDAVLQRALGEKVTRAPQVARSFFPDIAHEDDVGLRGIVRRLHRPDEGEQHGQTARVIPHTRCVEHVAFAPHLHVGARREDGIEMRGDDDQRPAARALAHAVHIALGIRRQIRQALRPQHFQIGGGTCRFLEGRRLDLGQLDHVGDDPFVVRCQLRLGRGEFGAGEQLLRLRVPVLCPRLCRHDRRGRQQRQRHQSFHVCEPLTENLCVH